MHTHSLSLLHTHTQPRTQTSTDDPNHQPHTVPHTQKKQAEQEAIKREKTIVEQEKERIENEAMFLKLRADREGDRERERERERERDAEVTREHDLLRTRLTGTLYISFSQKKFVFPQKSPVFALYFPANKPYIPANAEVTREHDVLRGCLT